MHAVHATDIMATWQGSFNGAGIVDLPKASIVVSLPTEFGGSGASTSPEDLLGGALASCFLVTFGIVLAKANVEYTHLSVKAELRTEIGPPAAICEIVFQPFIISSAAPELIRRLVEKVDSFCVISKVLNASVKKTVQLRHQQPTESGRAQTKEIS